MGVIVAACVVWYVEMLLLRGDNTWNAGRFTEQLWRAALCDRAIVPFDFGCNDRLLKRELCRSSCRYYRQLSCGVSHVWEQVFALYRIDVALLRRARRGVPRVRHGTLNALTFLPCSRRVLMGAFRLALRCGVRERLNALCFGLRLSVGREEEVIETFPWRLTPLEVVQIGDWLIMRHVWLDCGRLLYSSSTNARMLGLCLAQNYCLARDGEWLMRAVGSVDAAEMERMLTFVAVAEMRLDTPVVGRAVRSLSFAARRRVYRMLIRNGYSRGAIDSVSAWERGKLTVVYVNSLIRQRLRALSGIMCT